MEEKSKKQKKKPPVFLKKPKSNERIDFLLLLVTVILVAFGFLMLFSASQNTSKSDIYLPMLKQGSFVILGFAAMMVTSRLDYHVYQKLAFPFFMGVMLVMYIVPFVGIVSHGAKRQLSLGFISFQPSEICKFALILFFAALLSRGRADLSNPKNLIIYGLCFASVALACILQSHLSAMIVIVGVGFIMLFAGGLPWKWIGILGGIMGAGVGALALLEPYRLKRVMSFLHPFDDRLGDGWQIIQSLYAVGSGGLAGLGFGKSRQKYGYLPEAQNDYVYAIVCEELGFIGGAAVILLFGLLVIRGMQISYSAKDCFGTYVAFGISVLIALQATVNIGVVLSVLPSTGMQLPFFSSGGTSLIIMMSGLGILMNISRSATQKRI